MCPGISCTFDVDVFDFTPALGWTEVSDPDLMITSLSTRRPKDFEFDIENGVATHNNGFSDHFQIVTTIDVV